MADPLFGTEPATGGNQVLNADLFYYKNVNSYLYQNKIIMVLGIVHKLRQALFLISWYKG